MPTVESTPATHRLEPIGTGILVKPDSPKERSEEGIYFPEGASQRHIRTGTVVDVGPECAEKYPKIKKDTRLSWLYDISYDEAWMNSCIELCGHPLLLLNPDDVGGIITKLKANT